jgi:hypothetical protein
VLRGFTNVPPCFDESRDKPRGALKEHTMESFFTKREARNHFKVGATKFAEDILPRLDRVYVGPRSLRLTGSSIARVTEEIIAQSAAVAAAAPPVPVNKRKARSVAEDA